MGTPDKIDPCVLIIKYWLFVLAAERDERALFAGWNTCFDVFLGVPIIVAGTIMG